MSLSGPANISAGGDSVDVTDSLSDEAKRIAIDAVQAMGLLHGGVDLLVDDYESEDAFIFLNELNPSSGLGPHLYPGFGERRDIPAAIIDFYFPGSKPIEGGHNWAFAYDDVARLFRDNVAESVVVAPLNVPREPAWRKFVVEHEADSIATIKASALGILRKREVNGYFRRIDPFHSNVVVSGELPAIELVERSLKNLANRSNARLKLASRAAFPATAGVRSS